MQLIEDRNISSEIKQLAFFHPPVRSQFSGPNNDMTNEDYRALNRQKFIWRPNGIVLELRYEAAWLNLYKADDIKVSADSARAILLPFTVPEEGTLNVSIDSEAKAIQLPHGCYKVFVELQDIPEEDLLLTEKYRAEFDYLIAEIETTPPIERGDISTEVELCTVTFVAAQERVEPQLLNFAPYVSYKDKLRIKAGEITKESLISEPLTMFVEGWKKSRP